MIHVNTNSRQVKWVLVTKFSFALSLLMQGQLSERERVEIPFLLAIFNQFFILHFQQRTCRRGLLTVNGFTFAKFMCPLFDGRGVKVRSTATTNLLFLCSIHNAFSVCVCLQFVHACTFISNDHSSATGTATTTAATTTRMNLHLLLPLLLHLLLLLQYLVVVCCSSLLRLLLKVLTGHCYLLLLLHFAGEKCETIN